MIPAAAKIAALLIAAGLVVAAVIASNRLLLEEESGIASPLSSIAIAGGEQTVFDWSRDACEPRDIPDAPARAFRDSAGRVQLIASHYVNRREVGPDLDRVRHRCGVVMRSGFDALPQSYDDREWIASTYTLDGRTIYALVHEEYQGYNHPGACSSAELLRCWYNAITFALSRDGGRTYRQPRGAAKLVATAPYRYVPDAGSYGLFSPSNIARRANDGHYYFLARVGGYRAQQPGACLLRTRNLASPASWRAWDGSGFGVRFIDPYREPNAPVDHTCTPVARAQIDRMSSSLTWNTYIERYLLVGEADGPSGKIGIYYSTSPDLIHWSDRRLLRAVEAPWTFECGDRDPVTNPSVLDPASRSRNFETTGRRPWLYFTRFHYAACEQTLDRDLVRVRLELSKDR